MFEKHHKTIILVLLIIIIIIACWSQIEPWLDTGRKMVLYFSRNCPHSVAMEKTWDYFAKFHRSTNIKLIKRNVDETGDTVHVLPTVRAFSGGRIINELHGNQSYDALEAFYYHVFELR